ncbi:MAG TPA: type IV pilus secretin PilQ [Terriglobales bacterium]|nr:type IV pilus secretin PilQ [Terriglobales bacterium]
MRKQLLSAVLPLLMLVLMAAAADTPNTGAATHAALQRLQLLHGDDGISLEITASAAITPKLSKLNSPARVVVDLPNTVPATSQRQIAVGSDGVKGVRIGMDGQATPTTRVVVDLEKLCQFEVVPEGDNKFLLKLHTGNVIAKASPHASLTVTASTQPPAKSVPSATGPATAGGVSPATPERTEVTASLPAVSAAPLTAKLVETAAKPSDYVFVEPSYQPKDDASAKADDKSDEPSARATEAAAKFADKPASELLPGNGNAAIKPQESQAPSATIQPAVNLAAEQKTQMAQQPAATGPKYTGEPISVNLKDVDLKDFFRLIHEISGLNVVLDPNVHGSLTIVLDDVPWDQALDIVLKNNDLARELDGNVLRIATVDTLKKEADARRAQKESEALAVEKVTVTRFLSYAHSKDVVPTIKKFLSQRGDVIADERTNAVIISDIPTVIPALDRLLTQLDRKTQEVEIEARVVAATRSFARDIGTQFGFGWGNGHSAVGGAGAVGTSPLFTTGLNPQYITVGSGGGTSGSAQQIPLFSNLPVTSPTSGLSFINASNNVRIDAVLTAAESRGLLKILSRPRVVTQNNIQALVRQGVRVPIVTQAQLGGPPTVTYVDAFLRLTVVPQITSEGTIFLNVDVENTTPDFGRTVQGNPTLITQQATTQVLVTDGGTVVIGGVIQTNNSLNVSQVPFLGDVPVLGNLFKHRTVSTSNQELIFFITPRIIQT